MLHPTVGRAAHRSVAVHLALEKGRSAKLAGMPTVFFIDVVLDFVVICSLHWIPDKRHNSPQFENQGNP